MRNKKEEEEKRKSEEKRREAESKAKREKEKLVKKQNAEKNSTGVYIWWYNFWYIYMSALQ